MEKSNMIWKLSPEILKRLPRSLAIFLTTTLVLFSVGCPPKTKSLVDNSTKVTRQELQIELTSILTTAEYRLATLDKQEEFRKLIFQNALVIVEGQPLNPLGLLTAFAGIYGVATATKNTVAAVKKKVNGTV